MDKKRLQELKDRLEDLQRRKGLPDIENLTENLVKQEVAALREKLKENPTIRALKEFQNELLRFKKDFDLKPISDSVNSLSDEMKAGEKALTEAFESKLKTMISGMRSELSKAMSSLSVDAETERGFNKALIGSFEGKIASIRDDLYKKVDARDSTAKGFKKDLNVIRDRIEEVVKTIPKDKTKETQQKIEDLRDEIMGMFSRLGGGAMNRQMLVGGANPLTKYTDVNFVAGTGVTIAYADDNTDKNVDYSFSVNPSVAAGPKVWVFAVTDPNGNPISTGDFKAYDRVNVLYNTWKITAVAASVSTVSSSGAVTVQVRNATTTNDILSTALTIDANEKDSSTATTPAVINTSNNTLTTADQIAIDIDGAGTGAKGLNVHLTITSV